MNSFVNVWVGLGSDLYILMFFHAIPQFQELMRRPEKMAKMKFYKGRKGIQQLFLDDLKSFENTKEKYFVPYQARLFTLLTQTSGMNTRKRGKRQVLKQD